MVGSGIVRKGRRVTRARRVKLRERGVVIPEVVRVCSEFHNGYGEFLNECDEFERGVVSSKGAW